MEIEAKLRVIAPWEPERLTGLDLGPFALSRGITGPHDDVLLDTGDLRLTGSGHALRIRALGERRVLTLKGPGKTAGGVHRREEVEHPIIPEQAEAPYRVERWPEPIASRVVALAGDQELAPIARDHITRRTWLVSRGGKEVAEIAYDVGYVEARCLRDSVDEVEIEIKGDGSEEDLEDLSSRVRACLPVAPESRTKLARGLALREVSEPRGDLLLVDLLAHLIAKHEKRLRLEGHATTSVDDVHDARVALRRIRLGLAVGATLLPERRRELTRLRKRLGPLAKALGAVRDLDVAAELLEGLKEPLLDHTIERLGERREEEAARLAAVLGRGGTQAALGDLDRLHADHRPLEGPTAYHVAGTALWAGYERLLALEPGLTTGEMPEAHLMRKACRELRYTLDLFAPALGAATAPLVARLVGVQDYLGHLQDLVMTRGTVLDDALPAEARVAHVLTRLDTSLARQRKRLGSKWAAVGDASFRRQLAELLVALPARPHV